MTYDPTHGSFSLKQDGDRSSNCGNSEADAASSGSRDTFEGKVHDIMDKMMHSKMMEELKALPSEVMEELKALPGGQYSFPFLEEKRLVHSVAWGFQLFIRLAEGKRMFFCSFFRVFVICSIAGEWEWAIRCFRGRVVHSVGWKGEWSILVAERVSDRMSDPFWWLGWWVIHLLFLGEE